MNNFSILMFIFGILILLAGLYLYTGHKNEVLLWKVPDIKEFTKEETIKLGKWTMISSIIPFILAILGIIFNFE
ncbi:MAG: hypothetical protein IJI43_03780 [Bacilli bacterium]|nr:hypothetical protein [Bacilli bacterium]